MFRWHIVDSATYHAGTKVEDHLYFLSDTGEIYRGSAPFTESVVLYTTLPTAGIAINRLYINSTTLEGKIYDGSAWHTVIDPAGGTVVTVDEIETDPTKDQTQPVNSKAVISYVAAKLAELTPASDIISQLDWDAGNKLLELTMADGSAAESIKFDGLGVELGWEPHTGILTLKDVDGNVLGQEVNLELAQFVKSGEYNPETKKIILYFDDAKTNYVEIDAADLVDVYEAGPDTQSAHIDITDNKITADVRISTEAGNALVLKDDGLYIASIDDYIGKVEEAIKNNIPVFTDDGQLKDSGKSLDDYIEQDKIVKNGSLARKIETASDKRIPSEKALVACLTWIEGMGDAPTDTSVPTDEAAADIAAAQSGDTVYVAAGNVQDKVVAPAVNELSIIGCDTSLDAGLLSNAQNLVISDINIGNANIAAGAKIVAEINGSDVTLNNITMSDDEVSTRTGIAMNAPIFTVENCTFDGTGDNMYNTFENKHGTTVVEHAVFKNCVFYPNAATNNFVSIYDFVDGAVVEFEDCTFIFDGKSNALRFSNISNNRATIIIKNCKMKSSNDGEYAGLILFQDSSKDKTQDFSKLTVNLINLTNLDTGAKYMNNDGEGVDKIWYTYNTDTVPNVIFS